MAADVDTSETVTGDLPSNTWRRWWRNLPGYWRIGAWLAAVLLVMHAAIAVRAIFVYPEAAEITALRQQQVDIHYFWERAWWEPTGRWKTREEKFLYDCFWGRSRANVAAAVVNKPGNQDELLRNICSRFSNLECLIVQDAELSDQNLAVLTQCPRLKHVGFPGCNVTDDGVNLLTKHQGLIGLFLQGTLITDASLLRLRDLQSLQFLNICDTAITPSAISAWHASAGKSTPVLFTNQVNDGFNLAIVWPDGRRDSLFPKSFVLIAEGPLEEDDSSGAAVNLPGQFISQQDSLQPMLSASGDGKYRLLFSSGEHAAEPIIVKVQSRKLVPGKFEFRMPTSKSDTLRSIPK